MFAKQPKHRTSTEAESESAAGSQNHIICAVINSERRVCSSLMVIPFLLSIIYRCTGLCAAAATASE